MSGERRLNPSRRIPKPPKKRLKPSDTPKPFGEITPDAESDWISQQFTPASPNVALPIMPTSSPAMQMTKEKVSIPGLDDSPLSPLPQQLLDEAGNKKTPPPYITLESLAKVPGLELKSYDGGGDSSCMGSLSSYNNTRVRRGMDTHATGLRSRGSYRQKNPAELQAAIRRQMVKLQHLQQSIKAMEQQNPITDQATAAVVTPARDGNGSTHAEAKEAEDASGQNEQKNNGKVPTIATGFSSAFDASQLSLLRNYIEQNGGLPVRF